MDQFDPENARQRNFARRPTRAPNNSSHYLAENGRATCYGKNAPVLLDVAQKSVGGVSDRDAILGNHNGL